MGNLYAEHLQRNWGQQIKPSSKQCLVASGNPDTGAVDDTWDLCDRMMVLGHMIENSGAITADFDLTVIKLWRSFWKNSGRITSVACPRRHRLLLLRRATLPIADQHMVRWPYTRTCAKTIDRLQDAGHVLQVGAAGRRNCTRICYPAKALCVAAPRGDGSMACTLGQTSGALVWPHSTRSKLVVAIAIAGSPVSRRAGRATGDMGKTTHTGQCWFPLHPMGRISWRSNTSCWAIFRASCAFSA